MKMLRAGQGPAWLDAGQPRGRLHHHRHRGSGPSDDGAPVRPAKASHSVARVVSAKRWRWAEVPPPLEECRALLPAEAARGSGDAWAADQGGGILLLVADGLGHGADAAAAAWQWCPS